LVIGMGRARRPSHFLWRGGRKKNEKHENHTLVADINNGFLSRSQEERVVSDGNEE
jgi:hypothetical protein